MDETTIKLVNTQFVPLAAHLGYGAVYAANGTKLAPSFDGHAVPTGPNAKDNPFAPERLKAILAQFQLLSNAEKQPATLPDMWKSKGAFAPPAGGLVLRQYLRLLNRDADGNLYRQGGVEHDYLWLTQAERQSLVPRNAVKGTTIPLPFLASRMAQHHSDLLHASLGTRLEGPKPTLTATVEDVSSEEVRLRLQGSFRVVIGTFDRPVWGDITYQLEGVLVCRRQDQSVTRFDLAALGEVTQCQNPVPPAGRVLMGGLFFELCPASSPFERLPPGRAAFGGLERYRYWQ